MRERDNDNKTGLIYKNEHRGRLSVAYNDGTWSGKSQADVSYVDYKDKSLGWMISQNVSLKVKKLFSITAVLGYFNTDDYDSRVYSYERGMLYSFSFPAYYGNGLRCSLLATSNFSKIITIMAKIGTTKYFDRNTIGSGYQQIYGSSATDVELQVRFKL